MNVNKRWNMHFLQNTQLFTTVQREKESCAQLHECRTLTYLRLYKTEFIIIENESVARQYYDNRTDTTAVYGKNKNTNGQHLTVTTVNK